MCSNSEGSNEYDINSIALILDRQEAGLIAWSCAVLNRYPPQLMQLLYMALFGEGDDPSSLNEAYGDNGLKEQAVMSMLYVQMGLELESADQGLMLPSNYPIGWHNNLGRNLRFVSADDDAEFSSILKLSTSRLQKNISRVFKRINFAHELEHVITTRDIESEYGILLSSENIEFLSIDITNSEKKIGIEVDGPGHFVQVMDVCDPLHNGQELENSGRAVQMGKSIGWEFRQNAIRKVNGSTALKDRLLENLGWRMAHIPFWEWRYSDNGGVANKENYCQALLDEINQP